MAPTKQVLRLQSDQTLDDAQLATRVRLIDLTATRAINLLWVEPAASDHDITFKDPTANDAVVYENLAQTLTNKTLPTPTITDFTNANHDHSDAFNGGSVDHSDITNPDATDDHAQYALLAGRATGQTIIGGSAANEDLSLQSTSDAARGEIVAIDDILMGTGKEVLGLPVLPSGPTAAASKAYVDSAVSGGASWKETLLSGNQLDSVNNAVANGCAHFMVNTAQIGDTFILSDGGTTETWTYAGVAGAFAPDVGASALDSMTSLAARINIDSPTWAAIFYAGVLQGINGATGDVVVIYRRVPTAVTADRLYGVFTTPADAQFIDFGGDTDYRDGTNLQVVAADPVTANFGFGRITSALQPNDTHLVRAEDSAFVWNEDAGTWQLSAGAVSLATSGSGGAVVGQATYDSDFGLEIVGGGVARVRVDGSTVTFVGGELAVAGGAIAFATSGPGGDIAGKVTMDSGKGLLITGGPADAIAEVKVDAVSIAFNVSGELTATGSPISPTGLISHGVLTTRDILGVTPPTAAVISFDVPVQDYINGITTGQLFDFVVPADYDSGDMEILASYQMTTAVAQDIVLETSAKIIKSSTGTIDTVTFSPINAQLPVPADTDLTRDVIKSLTNSGGSNFLPGDTIQLYVKRLGADGADLHTGTWRVTAFQFRYTGQVSTRLMESVVDIFTPVFGSASPSNDFFDTDIPVITYSDAADQAASARFVVPDNWDGVSDAFVRLQYGLDAAASGTVRLNTSGNIADVIGGAVLPLSSVDFDVEVTADIDPHRTAIIRSVPASLMSPGSVVQIAIERDVSVGGNAAAGFSAINATLAFGVVPVAGFSSITDFYLDDPVFGNIAGTVNAKPVYPLFASDFEYFFEMSSTAAAGAVHAAFIGRLSPIQTEISQIGVFIKGVDTGTVKYNLKVYAEGSGATPVFESGPTTPNASSVEVPVLASAFTGPQPSGDKRFFVVIEVTAMENGESVSFSKPFVQVQ